MKKIQALTLILGYVAFGVIMGWTVLGGVYLKSGRPEYIYQLCRLICLIALPLSICMLFAFKKTYKFFLYAVIPYLASQIIYPFVNAYYGLGSLGTVLAPFLYPYLFTLIWGMTLFMYLLDYALTRLLHHGR